MSQSCFRDVVCRLWASSKQQAAKHRSGSSRLASFKAACTLGRLAYVVRRSSGSSLSSFSFSAMASTPMEASFE